MAKNNLAMAKNDLAVARNNLAVARNILAVAKNNLAVAKNILATAKNVKRARGSVRVYIRSKTETRAYRGALEIGISCNLQVFRRVIDKC
ncbi:MAG: hypothetical protein LBK12_04895 [Odoribacteraceae bacterium]|jgi:NADH:ubiquinone oxidoreductase subunit D|nr:hypothetical protein [Odoribacteraceae bacterium]